MAAHQDAAVGVGAARTGRRRSRDAHGWLAREAREAVAQPEEGLGRRIGELEGDVHGSSSPPKGEKIKGWIKRARI